VEEERRVAGRRLPSTQRDLIHSLPRLPPVFARVSVYVHFHARARADECVGRSVSDTRKKRARSRPAEGGREGGREEEGREKALAREQGCTRALFACVRDVNIIRQTHLNRLKILTFTSHPPPLSELSGAMCTTL